MNPEIILDFIMCLLLMGVGVLSLITSIMSFKWLNDENCFLGKCFRIVIGFILGVFAISTIIGIPLYFIKL